MSTLIGILVVLALLIVPVKIAAHYVKAESTGAFMCLVALIFAAMIQYGAFYLVPQLNETRPALYFLVTSLLSAIAYMFVLGTTYIKGVIIAVIQAVLTVLIVAALIGLGFSLNIDIY